MSMYSSDPLMYLMCGSSFIVTNMLAIKYTAAAALVASKCSYLHRIFPSIRWVRTVISKYQYLSLTPPAIAREVLFGVRATKLYCSWRQSELWHPPLLWKALCKIKFVLFRVWCFAIDLEKALEKGFLSNRQYVTCWRSWIVIVGHMKFLLLAGIAVHYICRKQSLLHLSFSYILRP